MVLKAPDVPSVLLELGYLSSEKDLANLVDAGWRDRATDSIDRAIGDFFRVQAAPAGPAEAPLGLKRTLGAEDPAPVAAPQLRDRISPGAGPDEARLGKAP
jgi:N-acetylmuramoyl-L-alanine amidase